MRYLLLILVSLAGCVSQPVGPSAYDVRHCADLADQAHLVSYRASFMRQCLEISQNPMAFATDVPYSSWSGPGTNVGPYGPLGPTWQEFNSVFQQPPQHYQIIQPNHPQRTR